MPKWRDVNTFLRKWLVWNASEARMESRKMCCETHQDYPVHLRWLIEVNRSPVRSRRKHHGRYRRYWIAMTWLYSVLAFAFAWCISHYFAIYAVILFAVRWKFLTRSHTVWLNYCQTWSEKRSEAVQVSTLSLSYHFCSWFLANYIFRIFNEHLYSMLCHVLCHVMPLNRSWMIQASWAWKLGLGCAFAHICAKHHRLRSCRGSQALCPRSAATMWQQNRKVQMNMAELLGINWHQFDCHILPYSESMGKNEKSFDAHGSDGRVGISMWLKFSWGLICHAQGPWIRYVASRRIQRTGRHKCLRLDISSAKPCKTWQESQRVQRTREALRQLGAKKDLLNLDSYLLDRRWNQIANRNWWLAKLRLGLICIDKLMLIDASCKLLAAHLLVPSAKSQHLARPDTVNMPVQFDQARDITGCYCHSESFWVILSHLCDFPIFFL